MAAACGGVCRCDEGELGAALGHQVGQQVEQRLRFFPQRRAVGFKHRIDAAFQCQKRQYRRGADQHPAHPRRGFVGVFEGERSRIAHPAL